MTLTTYRKQKSGMYEVTFSNGEMLSLYEEILLKYDLLLHRDLTDQDFIELVKENQRYTVYFVALKYLKMRLHSTEEVKKYLKKKEYNKEEIEFAITKLQEQGYLNDEQYATSYIHEQLITTSKGPNKIRYDLEGKQIADSAITKALLEYTEDMEREKINKIIKRMLNSNRNKSGFVLKKKITSFLTQQGFHPAIVMEEISHYDFSTNQDIAKKEYEKLYRQLSRKYEGKELELKLKQKMYQRGLSYQEDNYE